MNSIAVKGAAGPSQVFSNWRIRRHHAGELLFQKLTIQSTNQGRIRSSSGDLLKQPVPLLGSYFLKTFFLSNSGSHLTKRDLPPAFGCADAVFQECAFESALLKLKLNNVIP